MQGNENVHWKGLNQKQVLIVKSLQMPNYPNPNINCNLLIMLPKENKMDFGLQFAKNNKKLWST